jgi:hypothetical protein
VVGRGQLGGNVQQLSRTARFESKTLNSARSLLMQAPSIVSLLGNEILMPGTGTSPMQLIGRAGLAFAKILKIDTDKI